ncbi:hypothetical protein MMC07_008200 [Pseudocyphellaria aurata]|nr:hypothetical protein [Pseudocyphellaria aurata]
MVKPPSSSLSGTLHPPRKSIELEDPGAHDLDTSDNEEDIFSDAQEGRGASSGANSPIPSTRVEKVDDHESYGEVPGTAAYEMRAQDAVPDELEIMRDQEKGKAHPRRTDQDKTATPGGIPIPKTVVQKVDPTSPSHGEVPGTTAHSIRQADAVPDVIMQASDSTHVSAANIHDNSNDTPLPQTLLTRIDSHPSYGQVPGTKAFDVRKGDAAPDIVVKGDVPDLPTSSLNRSALSMTASQPLSLRGSSPIAADGGFGPMHVEDPEVEDPKSDVSIDADHEFEEGVGEDFDDFEAGAVDEDFGEFNEEFEMPPSPKQHGVAHASSDQAPVSPFPLLDFTELHSLDDMITASKPYLDELFPTTQKPDPPYSVPEKYSIFLTDRSLSLWSQLVAPPPLQPPNWVRSRIRRLFLVSLGVPVDLDEILPASKQKKLILPSTAVPSDSHSPSDGRRNSSRVRLRPDNASSASLDQGSTHKSSRKRKGPPPPPELDLGTTRMLCTTTDAALSNFLDDELRAHVRTLEALTARASEVLEYWLTRKDNALGDKEAFEGVIENLVKHARRVRK